MYLELLVVRVDRGGGPTAKKYSGWRADLDCEMQVRKRDLVTSLLPSCLLATQVTNRSHLAAYNRDLPIC